MINIGMIGLNEGNGHPFSYSAIFNGYDPDELMKRCPFSLIKDYLPREHRNENFIDSAKVTHIWTQSQKLSSDVAKVSKIPNIVKNYKELIDKVDAIILGRDDPWNHLKMSEPFLKKGIPIFIDKQLVSTKHHLKRFIKMTGNNYKMMACSPIRYTRDLANAKKNVNLKYVKTIHGISRCSWMRYGHHLFEGIAVLCGLDIKWVRSLSNKTDHDIVQIYYNSGLNVILEFIENVQLPIQFTCFSEKYPAYSVPFQDFFYSFREMLKNFVSMVKTNKKPISFNEILGISKVILAGDISKKLNGIPVSPITLKPIRKYFINKG